LKATIPPLLCLLVLGCSNDRVSGIGEPRANSEWFSPRIALQLDAQGRLPANRPVKPDESEITPEQAIVLADSIISMFGGALASSWSQEAGRTVRANLLRQCGRVDFLEHPYTELPAAASPAFHARNGSKWAVRYCQRADEVDVQVFVSATGLSVSVEADGSIRKGVPLIAFSTGGVPQQPDRPESASKAAFTSSRSPISALPKHLLFGVGYYAGNQSFVISQSAASGASVDSRAYAKGKGRSWNVRTIAADNIEAETLDDGDQSFVVYRRSDALRRAEIAEVLRENK
jgi:hypothetical protein